MLAPEVKGEQCTKEMTSQKLLKGTFLLEYCLSMTNRYTDGNPCGRTYIILHRYHQFPPLEVCHVL